MSEYMVVINNLRNARREIDYLRNSLRGLRVLVQKDQSPKDIFKYTLEATITKILENKNY